MKAALYLRVSTDRQEEEGVSLDAQDRNNRDYAAANGYTVDDAHVYRDVGSGGELDRPVLLRMRDAAKRGEFQTVIADCLDRLVRDDDHRGFLRTEFRSCGVNVVFVNGDYGDDLAGGLRMSIDSHFAAEERRKISRRTRKAYNEYVEQGQPPLLGEASFGYVKVTEEVVTGNRRRRVGHLVVCENEAFVVKRLFRLVNEGMSVNAICRLFNDEGVPPPSANVEKRYSVRAAEWSTAGLAAMVRDPVYKGQRAVKRQVSIKVDPAAKLARKQAGKNGKTNVVSRPRDEWVFVPVPAIVSEEVWEAAQVAVASRRGTAATRNVKRPALLRGIVRCRCGEKLFPEWNRDSLMYRCPTRHKQPCGNRSIPGSVVEGAAWETVVNFLADPITVAYELQQRQDTCNPEIAADLKRVQRARADVERKQERLISLYAAGGAAMDLVRKELATLNAEKERLDTETARLTRALVQQQVQDAQVLCVLDYCEKRGKELVNADFHERRRLLDDLGIAVVARRPTRDVRSPLVKMEAKIPSAILRAFRQQQVVEEAVVRSLGLLGEGLSQMSSRTHSQNSHSEAEGLTLTLKRAA